MVARSRPAAKKQEKENTKEDDGEVKTNSAVDAAEENKTSKSLKGKKRRELPSVSYLLAHGAPESAGRPRTWMETVGYPVILAIVFAISLLIFHHAPHHKSKHKGFRLPTKKFQGTRPLKKDDLLKKN